MTIFSDADFNRYQKLIYSECGITFNATNRAILESRLKERLRTQQIETPDAYYAILTRDKEELKLFLDAVTTNLTRFFRNTAHFDALIHYVVPELVQMKHKTGQPPRIKVWSAGCSTGEEPYTIAMILKEILPAGFVPEILASDISLKCLMTGKQGFYPTAKMAGIPQNYIEKYFDKTENGYQAKQVLKDVIRFDYHNLMHAPNATNFDIVFCRNVLIYFDEAAQTGTIQHFWDAMNAHSYLFIGHSESLFGMKTKFEFVKTEWACLYRKNI